MGCQTLQTLPQEDDDDEDDDDNNNKPIIIIIIRTLPHPTCVRAARANAPAGASESVFKTYTMHMEYYYFYLTCMESTYQAYGIFL
jgi:hypothetical protein